VKCPQRKSSPPPGVGGGIFSGNTWKVRYTNQIRTRYRNWRTTSATQLQPSKSLRYIGYTATWLDVRSCVLMQEVTTCNIFCDGICVQHLAVVLISVLTRTSFSWPTLYKAVQRKSKPLTSQPTRPQPDRPAACVIGLYCVSDIVGSIMCAGLFSKRLHEGPRGNTRFPSIADFLAESHTKYLPNTTETLLLWMW